MNFSYTDGYNSSVLHGKDDPSLPKPWNLTKEILQYASPDKKLLDIGCGTAFKIIPLASHFKDVTGLDISQYMLNIAGKNINTDEIKNIKLVHADSSKLPFKDCSYDMVTCMLSRWNVNEISRVLKPNGVVIIEHIGCEDKKVFKILFGKDQDGWRGQFIYFQQKEYLESYRKMFDPLFNSVLIKNGFWKTYYTEQGLLDLLKNTPTIKNFDPNSDDRTILKNACEFFNTPNGIELTQNRILITGKKI